MAAISHGDLRDSLSNPESLPTNCFVHNIKSPSPTNIRSIQSHVYDRYMMITVLYTSMSHYYFVYIQIQVSDCMCNGNSNRTLPSLYLIIGTHFVYYLELFTTCQLLKKINRAEMFLVLGLRALLPKIWSKWKIK